MDGRRDVGLPLPWGIVPMERVWRRVDVPDPAVGADWDAVVPAGALWMVQSFVSSLQGDGTGGSRRVYVSIGDGEVERGVLASCGTGGGVVNLITMSGSLGRTPGDDQGARIASCGTPFLYLQPGWTFGGRRQNAAAGDQWSGIRLWVAEYEVRGLERASARYLAALREAV